MSGKDKKKKLGGERVNLKGYTRAARGGGAHLRSLTLEPMVGAHGHNDTRVTTVSLLQVFPR